MPIDVIVLAGFLGSGKTSLLVSGLAQGIADSSAVIVNESGEIGIDGMVIADGSDGVPIEMLENGCVCCSLGANLVQTLCAVLAAPRPSGAPLLARVIIETSGMSRPGPILASLADPALSAWQIRAGVVTTYDCVRGASDDAHFEEVVAQLAAAGRIVLTKGDLASNRGRHEVAARARAINPIAEIISSADRDVTARLAFVEFDAQGGREREQYDFKLPADMRHPRIMVLTGEMSPSMYWEAFSNWLDDLADFCGGRLLRLKAVVQVVDCDAPLLLQSVGTTFDMPRRLKPDKAIVSSLVVIVRDFDLSEFQAVHGDDLVRLRPRT